jgi:diguanylate cyclase (GGDEF)-like protein
MRPKILVVDDDANIRELVLETIGTERYATFTAADGLEAIEMATRIHPDLIILDLMMPGLDGIAVCGRLRAETLTCHVPIIMLTARGELENKLEGIEVGADDYITKPFDPLELEARINMHLRRSQRDGEASPLTGLPGNHAIEAMIQERIASGGKFAVCYVDLDQFKAYNDHYGFLQGSEVIKMTSEAILAAVERFGREEDFCGHIGGDDFIVITTMERAGLISEEIIRLFETAIPEYYEEPDAERGFIESFDRIGVPRHFSMMTISISIVHNTYREIHHPGKVAQIAAELKSYAKSQEGSIYVYDRRRNS